MNYFLKERSMMHERFDKNGRTRLSVADLALLTLLIGAFAVSCGGMVVEHSAEPQDGSEEQASVELVTRL